MPSLQPDRIRDLFFKLVGPREAGQREAGQKKIVSANNPPQEGRCTRAVSSDGKVFWTFVWSQRAQNPFPRSPDPEQPDATSAAEN